MGHARPSRSRVARRGFQDRAFSPRGNSRTTFKNAKYNAFTSN